MSRIDGMMGAKDIRRALTEPSFHRQPKIENCTKQIARDQNETKRDLSAFVRLCQDVLTTSFWAPED